MTGVDVRGSCAGSVRPGCIVALSLVGLLRYGSTDWRDMERHIEAERIIGAAQLREIAARMHNDAVDLWNAALLTETGHTTYRGTDFPGRAEIEAMQATLSRIAWPDA